MRQRLHHLAHVAGFGGFEQRPRLTAAQDPDTDATALAQAGGAAKRGGTRARAAPRARPHRCAAIEPHVGAHVLLGVELPDLELAVAGLDVPVDPSNVVAGTVLAVAAKEEPAAFAAHGAATVRNVGVQTLHRGGDHREQAQERPREQHGIDGGLGAGTHAVGGVTSCAYCGRPRQPSLPRSAS